MNAAEEVAQLLYSKTAALFPFSLLWLQWFAEGQRLHCIATVNGYAVSSVLTSQYQM
jgi:hypothetical protein